MRWPSRSPKRARPSADDRVYMEKFLERPRHIEFQVLGTIFGNVIHSGRARLLHAAPPPEGESRKRPRPASPLASGVSWASAASRLRAVGYRSAGTLEFLYQDGEFYFIEMKYPHPGRASGDGAHHRDRSVKAQLLVASGERLPYEQSDVQFRGHAMGVPHQRGGPQDLHALSGPIRLWHAPAARGSASNSHVYSGYNVPPNYDSLIGRSLRSEIRAKPPSRA